MRRNGDGSDVTVPQNFAGAVSAPEETGDRYYIARLTVAMATVDDAGEYQCAAVNDKGASRHSVYLDVRSSPFNSRRLTPYRCHSYEQHDHLLSLFVYYLGIITPAMSL